MPDLAPIADLGVPGFNAAAWQMVVAPSATPRTIVDKLHAELEAIMALPETRNAITRIGLVPADNSSIEQLQAFVRSEIVRWGEIVKRSGASVD
jgi:tripartite-type tricarboxylate transporter receptor subunit TctC